MRQGQIKVCTKRSKLLGDRKWIDRWNERRDDFNEEISVPHCTASLHVYAKEKHCVLGKANSVHPASKFIWNWVLSVERQNNRETRRGKTGRTKWPRCIRLSAAVHTGAPQSSSGMFLTPTVMQPRRAAELSQHRHGFPISSLTNRHAQLHWGMKLNAVRAAQSCKGERRFMLGRSRPDFEHKQTHIRRLIPQIEPQSWEAS